MDEKTRRSFRRWTWLLPVALVGVLAVVGSRWLTTGDAQAPETAAESQAAAKTDDTARAQPVLPEGPYTVAKADVTRTIVITGELKAAKSRELTSPRTRSSFGSAITFLVDEGTEVKQGQRLLEFDASALLSQKSEAERQLDEENLNIQKTKADLAAQRTDFQNEVAQAEANVRVAKLYAKIDKELLPGNTYQKYQVDLEKADLALEKAKERLANHDANAPGQVALAELSRDQAELNLKKIEGDLELLQVNAPQDGIVIYGDNWASNRKVQVGDTVFPGMTVLILPDLSTMQVEGFVYDTEFRLLSPGMVCEISLDAIPGRRWRGKIESLTSIAGRKGFATDQKVFRALIQPDSIDLSVMKPGMTARAEFTLSMASEVTAVPRNYISVDPRGQYYVLKDNGKDAPTPQTVQVGTFGDRLVQITSGLDDGAVILPAQKHLEALQ